MFLRSWTAKEAGENPRAVTITPNVIFVLMMAYLLAGRAAHLVHLNDVPFSWQIIRLKDKPPPVDSFVSVAR